MFNGENKEVHQSATQQLMNAAVYLRRASEAIMACQRLVPPDSVEGQRFRKDRTHIDSMATSYDVLFQQAAQVYFK